MDVMDGAVLSDLGSFIRAESRSGLLPWAAQCLAAERFGVGVAEIEAAALEQGVLPARYQRNRETITVSQQWELFRSTAVIIGCGGLGGYLVEELARLGVGTLRLIDPDRFEEHNLNRQLLSTPDLLQCAKVEVAAARVAAINPAVTAVPLMTALSRDNGRDLVRGATVVLDGLDNFPARLDLVSVCREMGIPLVHGAIGGWYGQVATQMPGDDISPFISGRTPAKGVEGKLGNPSFTPAVVASFQVAEACKIILGQEGCLRRRMLFINLLNMEIEEIRR